MTDLRFDFKRTPLAPPGTRVIVHETPDNHRTWAPNGVDVWYLVPAPDHYRCHRIYIPRTCAEYIAKIVQFFPHNCHAPAGISTSATTTAASALSEALLHPTPTPFVLLGDDQFAVIQTLSRIFSKVTENPPTAGTPKTPQLTPAGALQTDCHAPSPRVPMLIQHVFTPRVTMVPAKITHDNPPFKRLLITPAQCIRQPTATSSITEPDSDNPMLNS